MRSAGLFGIFLTGELEADGGDQLFNHAEEEVHQPDLADGGQAGHDQVDTDEEDKDDRDQTADKKQEEEPMEAIRVTDKEWEIAGVHYVRTEAMCNGFGVSLEMEFGEDKAGDEYILVLDGIHPVSTCRLHQLDENTGKIERVATLKEYRGQHYGAAAITAAEEWFAERGVKKIFINSRTEAVGFYEKLGYVADPKQITGTGAFQCIMTEKQL